MKIFLSIIAIFLVLIAVASIHGCTRDMDVKDIKAWHTERGDPAKSIEYCAFARGPYWIKEDHHRIYQVFTVNGHEYWWRCGNLLSDDVEQVK